MESMERTGRRPDELECAGCRASADPRVEDVLLCTGCLGRHHPACWTGACATCGGADALGPIRATPTVVPSVRIAPRPRSRRVRKGRVALVLALFGAVGLAQVRPDPPGEVDSRMVTFAPRVLIETGSDGRVTVRADPPPSVDEWGEDRGDTWTIEPDPWTFWTHVDEARARERAGDLHAARHHYDSALALDGTVVVGWLERSRLQVKQGFLEDALSDAMRATELAPSDARAWFQRGWVAAELERWAEAEAHWTRVLALAPNDAVAWSNRAFTRAYGGHDLAGAEADATRAIELAPSLAFAWNNRAWARLTSGNDVHAFVDARRSLELDPDNAWAHETLARIDLARCGGVVARRHLEDCLRIDPDYPRAALVRAELERLR